MRNAPCRCGSGKKFKHCCGSLSGLAKAVVPAADTRAAQQHFMRGVQVLRSGQAAAAVPILFTAVQADAGHFDAHHALGAALMRSGQPAEAGAVLAQAVALRPGSAAAWWDLGAAHDRQNQHEAAIEAYRRAVSLSPKLVDVQHRLGELYALYGRVEEAADCFDRAADAQRNTTGERLHRSDARSMRGDFAGAEQWARKAVALEPGRSAAHGTLAGLLYAQGRFEEAASLFEAALRIDANAAKYWYGLAHCRRYSAADGAMLDRMQAVLQRGVPADPDRMTLHFAMGKMCDDSGYYAQAMEHFDAANRLRAADLTFDRAGLAATVDRNIAQFTPEFFARHAGAGRPDETPLFIVGMYRSGTTLVEQIVSSHVEVVAGGELTVWLPGELEGDAASGAFDPAMAQAAGERYLAALRTIGPAATRVTDKLPFNFLRLGAIHALMPHARIIHCRRDPVDTCLSIYCTLFSSRVPFAARKDDLAFCFRQYARMMAHWRRVLPAGIFLEVEYERLVADREAETRRLVAFTGLDWDDHCLAPERNTRTIGTSSAWQARQPVYATSLQRWRRYAPWLGELRDLAASETSEARNAFLYE